MFSWVIEAQCDRVCTHDAGYINEAVDPVDLFPIVAHRQDMLDFLVFYREVDPEGILDIFDIALGFFGARGIPEPWFYAGLLRCHHERREGAEIRRGYA